MHAYTYINIFVICMSTCVCMHVFMYACMGVFADLCTYVFVYLFNVSMYVCVQVCMHLPDACMYALFGMHVRYAGVTFIHE